LSHSSGGCHIERAATMEATSKPTSAGNSESIGDGATTTILLGLSGPSSSGKTTLARLLRSIFNTTVSSPQSSSTTLNLSLFILHQDDFYLTDALVPVIRVSSPEFGTRDLQDWDCVESLDLGLFEDTMRHVQRFGRVPEGSVSKEDQNAVGESGVSDEEVASLKKVLEERLTGALGGAGTGEREIRICILDGFLLYPPPPSTTSASSTTSQPTQLTHLHHLSQALLLPRLFLPSTRSQTLSRRARRSGYVTLEGFWTDPAGYVEDVVWPNYARDHGWMYVDGNVERGVLDEDRLLREEGIVVCPGSGAWEMGRILDWAVDVLGKVVVQTVERGEGPV